MSALELLAEVAGQIGGRVAEAHAEAVASTYTYTIGQWLFAHRNSWVREFTVGSPVNRFAPYDNVVAHVSPNVLIVDHQNGKATMFYTFP